MIETEITVILNRKPDLDLFKGIIFNQEIHSPIYILESKSYFKLTFKSDYEHYELDNLILDQFPNYEFTTDLGKGRKEIRLQITRYQSELQSNGWGGRIEDPLNETKYFIRKTKTEQEHFDSKISVLFEDNERNYYVNVAKGIHKTSKKEGFLLLKEFREDCKNKAGDFFNDKLYSTEQEAFRIGLHKLQEVIHIDYKQFLELKKKEKLKNERLPRKIVREFIGSVNSKDMRGVLKKISDDVKFVKRENWNEVFTIHGKKHFENYLESSDQEIYGLNLKIRSKWNINGDFVTIGVSYFPLEQEDSERRKYVNLKFQIKDKLIVGLIQEV